MIRKYSYSEQFCGKTSEQSTRAQPGTVDILKDVWHSVPTPSQESLLGKQSLSKYLHQHRLNRKWLPSQARAAFAEVSIPKDRKTTLHKYIVKHLQIKFKMASAQ